jgi:hypothetical protein
MTAGFYTLPDAAKLLSLPPLVLQRAAVRGQLKIDKVQDKPFVRMANLEAFVAAKDDTMPEHSGGWFSGDQDLHFVFRQAQSIVSNAIPESAASVAEVQSFYDRERKPLFTKRQEFLDPTGLLKQPISKVLTIQRIAEKYNRFGSIIMGTMVHLAREMAYRTCATDMSVTHAGKSNLEKLYTPEIYEKVLAALPAMMSGYFTSKKFAVKVKDKLTGGEIHVPTTIDISLAKSILPSVSDVVRLAF